MYYLSVKNLVMIRVVMMKMQINVLLKWGIFVLSIRMKLIWHWTVCIYTFNRLKRKINKIYTSSWFTNVHIWLKLCIFHVIFINGIITLLSFHLLWFIPWTILSQGIQIMVVYFRVHLLQRLLRVTKVTCLPTLGVPTVSTPAGHVTSSAAHVMAR